jgi:uncharacterized protein (UPF0297 family)
MKGMERRREEKRALIEKLARSSIIHRAFLHTWLSMPPLLRKVTMTTYDGTEITLDYYEDREIIEEVLKKLLEEEEKGKKT